MHGNATPLLGEDHSHFFDLKSPSFSSLVVAVRQPYAGHALAQSAFFQEILFEPAELLVEQGIARLPPGGRVLDLGVGSGCILLSVLAERPDVAGGHDLIVAGTGGDHRPHLRIGAHAGHLDVRDPAPAR